ncbi:MAG TPA: trigger factor [Candidatus Pacearchaeota archaeon]|nr:trigger factor [Candidatus Pacearchaeota archaeon]
MKKKIKNKKNTMKTEIKDVSSTKKKVQIEINAQEFNVFYEKALKEMIKELEMPGFRKGMVPESIAKEKISENNILGYGAELAVKEKWDEFLETTDLEIISQPAIEVMKVAKDNEFIFSAEVEVLSEITLPDYISIAKSINKEKAEVSEKEIEDALKWLQQSRAKFLDKQGPVEKGDYIEITVVNNNLKDAFMVNEGESFINMNINEEKQVNDSKIRVDAIKKVELPEINDELAKTLGKFDTLESLKNNIKEGIQQEKDIALKQKQRGEALEKIASKTKIEVPESLIQRECSGLINNLQNRVKNELNISFEEYLAQTKKTKEQVEQEFRKIGEQRVRNFLIIRQIIKNQDIKLTNEEIEARMNEILANYPDKSQIDLERIKLYIEDELKNEKVFELLGI